jgi:hypothetical protein
MKQLALCPLCRDSFEHFEFYTGTSRPRFFCPKCIITIRRGDLEEVETLKIWLPSHEIRRINEPIDLETEIKPNTYLRRKKKL